VTLFKTRHEGVRGIVLQWGKKKIAVQGVSVGRGNKVGGRV
jgi:hypothetical protein